MDWSRVQEIFWSARARPPAERDAFLVEACGDDAAALAQLRRMLAADATESGVLDRAPSLFTPLAQSNATRPDEHVGPYILAEELGRGGMGVVYRAYDPRLHRDVALKFLVAGRQDAEVQRRFINEARAASALDHPNNCPVYDIGSTDEGRLYIAMAYCAGGSLAQRLSAGPLPIAEAVRIAEQIAKGLERAHSAGIVHRDIKPANIAFTARGDARILDFGIAAFGEESDAVLKAGTPGYMAPEQVRGEAVDRRTDVWALGAVLYEMLTGRKAFDGGDRAEVARAILESAPVDVRRISPQVPTLVARIVARALAKDPAQRFQTAAELAAALQQTRRGFHVARTRIGIAAALVVMLAVAGYSARRWLVPVAEVSEVDANAVVVLPFHVSGDSALAYLAEGMVDLVSAKLTGEGGLRAADPRSVLSRARDGALTQEAGLAIARELGVGHALFGNIVGTGSALIINATLVNERGRIVGRASEEGPHKTLSALVDRLVAALLSEKAGEEPQRLATLTSTSLPALRAYLEGQAAYRRGRFPEALEKFGQALDYDSTFALAGLGLELADGWVGTGHASDRGGATAWRWRERLSARDRALLSVRIGDNYPEPITTTQKLAATERALRLAPDRAELWYTLGDLQFHYGRAMGTADWDDRAKRAFQRALELDSLFEPPRHHLIALYARQNYLPTMLRAARASLAHEPQGATAEYIRWRLDSALGNTKGTHEALDSLPTETLAWIAMISIDDGLDQQQTAVRALRLRAGRPGTREQRLERLLSLHAAALNGGQPARALALTDSLREVQPDSTFYLRLRVLAGWFGDGDRAAAGAAAASLVRSTRDIDRCVAALWRGDRSALMGNGQSAEEKICRAALTGDVAQLDELYRAGPFNFYTGNGHIEFTPVALARLRAARADTTGALAAIRLRPYFIGWHPFLAASLREEGRLAALRGEREAAVQAYQHYLSLRFDPEPARRASVDSVRAALAALRDLR